MPRLWVDLTTSWEEQGNHPHGTTRTERGIVGAFAEGRGPPGFVAFDRASRRFVPLGAEAVRAIVTAPVRPSRGRDRAGPWRRRAWAMEGRIGRLFAPRPRRTPGPADPFGPGDAVLFSGEHGRHDFGRLQALKREKRLRLAFVLFDLLRVLDDGDPLLASADPSGLPQTDFITREADLVLPISRFSAGEFRGHLRRRGLAGPQVVPIRLAGAPPRTGVGEAVPGLSPGRFVLCVGDVVQRKNHALLLRVWRRLADAPVLAVVGRIDMEGNALVDAVRADPALSQRIRFLPNADDDALHWLYRNCRFSVFPSRLEGFGLPVAESLAYGKVCVASSAAAIPEAGQGCAISLGPEDEEAWADAVARLLDDAALAAEAARVAAGFRPVSWADTAADIRAAMTGLSFPG